MEITEKRNVEIVAIAGDLSASGISGYVATYKCTWKEWCYIEQLQAVEDIISLLLNEDWVTDIERQLEDLRMDLIMNKLSYFTSKYFFRSRWVLKDRVMSTIQSFNDGKFL
jgi:hypothetical protein